MFIYRDIYIYIYIYIYICCIGKVEIVKSKYKKVGVIANMDSIVYTVV